MTLPQATTEFAHRIKRVPEAEGIKVQGLIYGPSGVGKTRLALSWTGGKVLVANIEDGYMSISGSGLDMVDLRKYKDFLDLYQFLKSGKHDYGLVWVDSFTEAKRFVSAQVADDKVDQRMAKNPYQLSMDDYKQSNEMLRQWVWAMRSLPLHVFYVCLSITSRRQGDFVTKQTIDLGESLANSVFAYCSLVGYMTIEEVQKPDGTPATARVLHLQPTDDYDAKLRVPPGFPAPTRIVAPTLDKILSIYKKRGGGTDG